MSFRPVQSLTAPCSALVVSHADRLRALQSYTPQPRRNVIRTTNTATLYSRLMAMSPVDGADRSPEVQSFIDNEPNSTSRHSIKAVEIVHKIIYGLYFQEDQKFDLEDEMAQLATHYNAADQVGKDWVLNALQALSNDGQATVRSLAVKYGIIAGP